MAKDLPLPRPRRHRRRRHHRDERRLPPHAPGLDRRRGPGAGPAVGRHDLARCRSGRAAARRPRTAPGSCSTPPTLYSALEAETGLATGYKRCGGVTVARTPERMVQLRRTAATAEAFDLECESDQPERAKELYPMLETEDLLGRHLAARRRDGQPDRRHPVARQGRAPARRVGLRAHPGHRDRPGAAGRHRRPHRPGRHRGRGRRQLRRPVGQGGRRDGRGQRAAALGRALLRRHRADRRRAPDPADPARPRRLHVLQGGGRRARRRRLRARGQAVGGAGPAARTRSSSSCWTRTGTTSRS